MTINLSIIIPTHNSELSILRCLESIEQQYYSDLEILIQDCYSKDNTIEIINEFQRKYPLLNIQIKQYQDSSVYEAMNIAIGRASGEWIYFLGSDDWLYSKRVLSSVFNKTNLNYDAIYGNVSSNHLGERYAGRFSFSKLYKQNICHQSLFLRRRIFSCRGLFAEEYKIAADWEHNLRWFLDPAFKVCYIDMTIAKFGDSGISSKSADYLFEEHKNLLFIYWGRYSLPFPFKLELIRQSIFNSVQRRNLRILLRSLLFIRFLFLPKMPVAR